MKSKQKARFSAQSAAAFTMLELMLSLGIVAIIMLISVPSLGAFFRDQQRASKFREIEAFLTKASERARLTDSPAYVVLVDDQLILTGWKPMLKVLADSKARSKIPFSASFTLPENAKVEMTFPASLLNEGAEPLPYITFWPTGTCEPAVVKVRSKGENYDFDLAPLTSTPSFTSIVE